MVPRSTYRESRPSPPLDPWIACFWSQTIARGAEDFLQRVLPDGCIDIIWFGSGSPRVVGPATIPFVERVSPGTTITGVRFRPAAGAAALNVAATELRNLQLELAAVVGSATARQFEAPELLERTLRNYLVKRPPPDPLATALVTALERRLADPVHTVVAAAGISDRHARRRFRHAVGYGLKTFQRIARLAGLRAWAAVPDRRSLSQIACDFGYADQAHLTRETRLLAGMTPAKFIRVAPTIQAISDGRNLQDSGALAR